MSEKTILMLILGLALNSAVLLSVACNLSGITELSAPSVFIVLRLVIIGGIKLGGDISE